VVVSGAPEAINRLQRDDVVLELDLRGTLSGANLLTVTAAMFKTSAGISVASFTPATVEVVLSRLQ
jgi:hypothetical protein